MLFSLHAFFFFAQCLLATWRCNPLGFSIVVQVHLRLLHIEASQPMRGGAGAWLSHSIPVLPFNEVKV